jgi:hypothetical protein
LLRAELQRRRILLQPTHSVARTILDLSPIGHSKRLHVAASRTAIASGKLSASSQFPFFNSFSLKTEVIIRNPYLIKNIFENPDKGVK